MTGVLVEKIALFLRYGKLLIVFILATLTHYHNL